MIKKLIFALALLPGVVVAQNETGKLDSVLTSIYRNDQPGLSVIIRKGEQTLYQRSIGLADMKTQTHITPATNFNICSLTKQITAYALVKLFREKKLSLDDPIRKFFPDMNPVTANAIRVRNLLNHSSGLVDHYDLVDRKAFQHFLDKDAYEAVKKSESTYFPVGTSYRYSNTAFCLLALIIEKVSGKTYPEYIQENIFKPLKMDNSLVLIPDRPVKNRALGYNWDAGSGTFKLNDLNESIFFSTMGDGGVYTSVNDYIKWGEAFQNGKVLDKDIINQVRTRQNPVDAKRGLYYGYGWFVSGNEKNRCYYHTGSNGGFRTLVYCNPAARYSLVIFSNRTGVDLEELAKKLNSILKIDNCSFIALESLIS